MSLSKLPCLAAIFICSAAVVAVPIKASAQTNYYSTSGSEYAVAGALPGDQMFPDTAINPAGGFVVWQDNATDGSGWGISAERLDGTFSGTLSPFRVNIQGANDQKNPHVALLKNGGAVFVWQGGASGKQHIFARFLSPDNTWLSTNDILVGTVTNSFQINPAVTVLNDSNVVVVWSSYNQVATGSMLDVYGSILSPTGQTISNGFLINQFTQYNQRNPAVAALSNGGFVVAWISEQEQVVVSNLGSNSVLKKAVSFAVPSVDVYARLYQSNGVAAGGEFPLDPAGKPCATPVVAAAANGGFVAAWAAHDMVTKDNSWDIYARPFSSTGTAGAVVRVNSHLYGDQYSPKISAIGQEFLVVWTSLAQDGSREGVYGQFVHADGTLVGGELRVNTTTQGQQMQQAVASDGSAWFQVVWTSYTQSGTGFDLFAQRYANVAAILQPMNAPFVYAPFDLVSNKYVPQLVVSWPLLPGISVANFQVFLDNSATTFTNLPGTTNVWVMGTSSGLKTNVSHVFQVGYVTTDGHTSPVSAGTTGATWSGASYHGIPFEWMEANFGGLVNFGNWPGNVNVPLTPGGMSLYNIYLSGGNPEDPSTWLTTTVNRTPQGIFLNWNTQPGQIYQVQSTANLKTWTNVGSARFAAGNSDSIDIGNNSAGLLFRVVLLRQ